MTGLQQQLAKVDFQSRHRRCATISGPNGYPGEPLFIATPGGAEDDGVIVTLVFDAERKRTDIVGLDARDLAARPLFAARLAHHVPFMLHGTFTPRLF